MIRLRHTEEWIGALVVAALVLFLGAVLQAGVLRDWFRPVAKLRIVLPEAGVGGLSVGADVEVLGIRMGKVRRIVISPEQQIYAEAEIDEQARAFIRRDSRAVIRRRFDVAGAAYVEIERGNGPELDWSYAVVTAATERGPTEGLGALIDQLRDKVFPILDDTGRATRALAEVAERINKGEGNVGRLVGDETLARDLEAAVAEARGEVANVARIIAQLELAMGNVTALTATANARDGGVPELLRRANQALASLQDMLRDLNAAALQLPPVEHNLERGTENLPGLVTQFQQTAHELELLLAQLRGNWLLGGGPQPVERTPLPSTQIRP
ncbi:MAG TPA: MlaD family protein [Stellaceae bacterium]|nr:MlaD family protein [Stellaceae bacterium]